MDNFRFFEPSSLHEATLLLLELGSDAAVMAGGTDLINQIKSNKRKIKLIIGLRKVKELNGNIQEKNNGMLIGALATLDAVAFHSILSQHCSALVEAASTVGSKQIRNRATLVGNICNASPAADTTPALLIYDAVVNIIGKDSNRRSIAIDSFITSPGKTVLAAGEIVESVFVPFPSPFSASTYYKLSRREGVDLAIVNVATYLDAEGGCKIALGAVGPRAFRAYNAEKALKKQYPELDNEAIDFGLREIVKEAAPISDLRASREYRLAMMEVLTRKTLETVVDKIRVVKG